MTIDKYEFASLWKSTLGEQETDEHKSERTNLREVFYKFRKRVTQLVSYIQTELPGLTVHDITHIDALWRVASQIAGPRYVLNPAEAFVLGGAFLLHDAAHAIAAYEDGKVGIKRTPQWQDLIAHRYEKREPTDGSPEERAALFQVLRHLHAAEAAKLPTRQWKAPNETESLFLMEDTELRRAYGELIGQIAESHHWPALEVAAKFKDVNPPPSFLPTEWTVDAMKVAFLLRAADAAHIDDARAPWFLFALQKPVGISEQHWRFQSKLAQPICNANGELHIASTSGFNESDREAWWLAFDTVQMIDRELRDAHGLMRDHGRDVFQAQSVLGAGSPESFARYVRPQGWEPVEIAPKISDVHGVIELLGGKLLYGNKPEIGLRELLQNAIDAVRARRSLGRQNEADGRVIVSLNDFSDDEFTLTVTDNGIGMTRYVMTNLLLDFGRSLWRDAGLTDHLPGLAASGFEAAGRFGIGFYAVLMLGDNVTVSSYPAVLRDTSDAKTHEITFTNGLKTRPSLISKLAPAPDIAAGGTSVSVRIKKDIGRFKDLSTLNRIIRLIAPASEVTIDAQFNGQTSRCIQGSDWKNLSDEDLNQRIGVQIRSGETPIAFQPLLDDNGILIGRIRPKCRADRLAETLILTHGGLKTEHLNGELIGVITGAAPQNIARTDASMPQISQKCWAEWAQKVINDINVSQNRSGVPIRILLALNKLSANNDLLIYERFNASADMLEKPPNPIQATSLSRIRADLTGKDAIIVICDSEIPESARKIIAQGALQTMRLDDFRKLFAGSHGNFDCEVVMIPGTNLLPFLQDFPSFVNVAFNSLERLILESMGKFERFLLDSNYPSGRSPQFMVMYRRTIS
jgi:hypothetical protein